MRRYILVFLALLALMAGCGRGPQIPVTDIYQTGYVQDLSAFPQDLNRYAHKADARTRLWDEARSAERMEHFLKRFYASWEITAPGKGHLDYFKAQLARTGSKRGYAENLQPWDEKRWEQLTRNADYAAFPNMQPAPAITVGPSSLRLAPTNRPRFVNPVKAGQGYPFDEFQQSTLPLGFPVTVLHASKDGQWLYVENSLAPGWIRSKDVALTDPKFMAAWKHWPLAAILKDGLSLDGFHSPAMGAVGTVLPLRAENERQLTLLVPARSLQGKAEIRRVTVDRTAAAPMPLEPTVANVAALGNLMLGQAYGWGGLYGNRDCSSMMRDLFAPFGLWLPRNSGAQATAGTVVDISKLGADLKEKKIVSEGKPFATLLWMKGHIGLYVGEHQGQPAYFHNVWGLGTREKDGSSGRHVLGRAVVTSTRPGRELPQVDKNRLLIHRMEKMVIFE